LQSIFLKKYSVKYNKSIKYISEDSLDYLTNYDYDGNVRELEAMIERASILTNTDKIRKK
jgi:Transcriptional regulator containing PAS, AAA-type ATPase, and DNA-binding domains